MDYDFNPAAFQLALAQARGSDSDQAGLDLAWSYVQEDHPYEAAGQTLAQAQKNIADKIAALGSGQRVRMPDGISVVRHDPGKGYSTSAPGGFSRSHHNTPNQAAAEVLDKSARNEHESALGGEVHFHNAAAAFDAAKNGLKHDGSHYDPNLQDPDQAHAAHAYHQHHLTTAASRDRLRAAGIGLSGPFDHIDFDPEAWQLALAQEALNLSWANVVFDPSKHPRLHGKFRKTDHAAVLTDEIGKLNVGQSMTHATSGVSVRRAKNPHYSPSAGNKPDAYYVHNPGAEHGHYAGGTPEMAANEMASVHNAVMKRAGRQPHDKQHAAGVSSPIPSSEPRTVSGRPLTPRERRLREAQQQENQTAGANTPSQDASEHAADAMDDASNAIEDGNVAEGNQHLQRAVGHLPANHPAQPHLQHALNEQDPAQKLNHIEVAHETAMNHPVG